MLKQLAKLEANIIIEEKIFNQIVKKIINIDDNIKIENEKKQILESKIQQLNLEKAKLNSKIFHKHQNHNESENKLATIQTQLDSLVTDSKKLKLLITKNNDIKIELLNQKAQKAEQVNNLLQAVIILLKIEIETKKEEKYKNDIIHNSQKDDIIKQISVVTNNINICETKIIKLINSVKTKILNITMLGYYNKKILKVKINNINLKSNNLKLKQANLQTILQESETKINNNNITLDKNIADNAALLLRYETQIQTLDLSSSLFLVTKSNQLSNQVPLSTISCSLNSIKN